jgi:hypothetical protein
MVGIGIGDASEGEQDEGGPVAGGAEAGRMPEVDPPRPAQARGRFYEEKASRMLNT